MMRRTGTGDQAARRFLEFFAATIRNKNTRLAYYHAAVRFFARCDHHKVGEIADIEPLHVAAYVEVLGKDFEKPTVKQHLAAIRMLFDWLVTGQVVATNPAHSVRGPKHVVKTGKTTVLTGDEARELLDSIDTSTNWPVWTEPIRIADLEAALCCCWTWLTMHSERQLSGKLYRFLPGRLREP